MNDHGDNDMHSFPHLRKDTLYHEAPIPTLDTIKKATGDPPTRFIDISTM